MDFNILEKIVKEYLNSCELTQMFSVYEPRIKAIGVKEDTSLRYVMNNEIVIEFDDKNPVRNNILINILKVKLKGKYTFAIYSHGGNSPHLHIYDIKQLDELDEIQRIAYRKKFILKYTKGIGNPDLSLTSDKHPIAMEFKPHWKPKYNNQVKELVYFNRHRGENTLENSILNEVNRIKPVKVYDGDHSWIIDWVLNHKIPEGGRSVCVWKNLAIELNKVNNPDYIIEQIYLKQQDYEFKRELKGWMKWAKNSNRKVFVFEVYRYAREHDILNIVKTYRRLQQHVIRNNNKPRGERYEKICNNNSTNGCKC